MAASLNSSRRRRIRAKLRITHGDRCIWCGGLMKFPSYGQPLEDVDNMATIEHHRAKVKGMGHSLIFLDLAHKKCNK